MTHDPQSVAYLGPVGTWSELAARQIGGSDATFLPLTSMPAVVTAVETGAASVGVLPIENALEGSVSTTLDVLIHETRLRIVREIVLPIRNVLAARPGLSLDAIEVLYSHPQPLAQSRRFVERCLPSVATVAALSTAAALRDALADERRAAALTTGHAAAQAGAVVLARSIQDRDNNCTRFVVLAPYDAPPSGNDKTSLAFTLRDNRAGALYRVLELFARANINLSKIESRPTKAELGDYVFLLDLDGHREDAAVARALRDLEQHAATLKLFGSYPRSPAPVTTDD